MKARIRRLGWRFWAFLACMAVFFSCGGLFLRDLHRSRQERYANQQLAQQAALAREAVQRPELPAQQAAPALPKYAESGILYQYDALWQQNHDLGGWLRIEGTELDYPVMYTPDNPEYYLRRAFDGSYALSGSLFIGAGCAPESSHVIIYGHHMKDGTMFGSLIQYRTEDYALEHPVICFDTLTEEREYAVIAAFYSRVYNDQDRGVFRYYQYTDLSDPETFDSYLRQAKAASLYDTGADASYGDKLLTLSTCSYHTVNGRFVVVAAAVPEEPDTVPEGTPQ